MNYLLGAIVGILLLGVAYLLGERNREPVSTTTTSEQTTTTPDGGGTVTTKETPTLAVQGRTLDMSGKGLTKVSNSVFEQSNLEALDVSNNTLSGSLQAEVRNLSNLRVLDLSDNAFTGVPAEVGQLSKLEILNLSNNPITVLPNEIGNLKNLKVLDLRGTKYSTLDLETIKKGLPTTIDIKID